MSSRPNVARTSSKDPMLVMAERDCLILSRSDRLPALVGSAMVMTKNLMHKTQNNNYNSIILAGERLSDTSCWLNGNLNAIEDIVSCQVSLDFQHARSCRRNRLFSADIFLLNMFDTGQFFGL